MQRYDTSRCEKHIGQHRKSSRNRSKGILGTLLILIILVLPTLASAQDASPWTTDVAVDTLWVLVAGMLVFFMNTGFGCVESGFCRSKNTVNILGKNFVVFGIASVAFWIVGWALMFGWYYFPTVALSNGEIVF